MKKTSASLFASVSLIITVGLATTPLTGRADPEVAEWSWNLSSSPTVPSGLSNVVAIAAGGSFNRAFNLALTAEGRVVAWGIGSATNVPNGLSNVVAIAAGGTFDSQWQGDQSLALTSDGRVVAWGGYGGNFGRLHLPITLPPSLKTAVAIVAGNYHGVALVGLPPGVAAPAWA